MAKAGGRRRARPGDDATILRQVVSDYLVDTDDEHADRWLDLSEQEADQLVEQNRGVAGVLAQRGRWLSGEHGLAGAVHEALSARELIA